jgi:hypothetical protein
MKVITVATQNKFYYDILVLSLKKHNIELITLGWGQYYTSHLLKDKLVLEYISELDDEEIIVYIDGYDSVVTDNFKKIESSFIESKHDIIISTEQPKKFKFFHYIFYLLTFGMKKHYLNTGMYIGRVGKLNKVLNDLKQYTDETFSNQRVWQRYYDSNNSNMYLDINNKFFLNISDNLICTSKINKIDTLPYVISSPGIPKNMYNFNKLLNAMGYNDLSIDKDNIWVIRKILLYKQRNILLSSLIISIFTYFKMNYELQEALLYSLTIVSTITIFCVYVLITQ